MPFHLIRNDITKMKCDAIVNAANNSLLGGGGVDGAIHKAAGGELLNECRTLGGCETGDAKITGAYNLPCKYVIHTVGPVWRGGIFGEKKLLESCFEKSLQLAKENGCKSIAFPLISAGVYGYPREKVIDIASETIYSFLENNEMTVYLVVFDKESYFAGKALKSEIQSYIDDNYVDEKALNERKRRFDNFGANTAESMSLCDDNRPEPPECDICFNAAPMAGAAPARKKPIKANRKKLSLDDELKSIDESFSEMLLRKIDEKGMKDSECYKKANIDRKLFSKIRNDKFYKPSKNTVLAFVIALELPLDEASDMLLKAGFALSHSSKFDIIVEYFIKNGDYDIYKINEVLFDFDQSLIGA